MMSLNLFWVEFHFVDVIDGLCRIVVSNFDSRFVASWNLMRSVCMFFGGLNRSFLVGNLVTSVIFGPIMWS